jgi:hypothetical protein
VYVADASNPKSHDTGVGSSFKYALSARLIHGPYVAPTITTEGEPVDLIRFGGQVN